MRGATVARTLLLLAAALLGPTVAGRAPRAHAHDHPDEIFVRVNESVTFAVMDLGSCSAFVSASVQDTSLATITPASGTGVTVNFTVTAKSIPGETFVLVSWIGEDVGGPGPCQEVTNSLPIRLVITALPEERSAGSRPNSGTAGDPVNTFTGELTFEEAPDLDLGGALPVRFQRYYASRMRINFVVGELGDNWRHGYEWRLYNVGTVLHLVTPRGKVAKYLKMGPDWVLQNKVDVPYEILQNVSVFRVSDPSTNLAYKFENGGMLTEIADGRGNRLLLDYDVGTGKLDRVAEDLPFGVARAIRFTYTDGKLSMVREDTGGVAGREVQFTHVEEELTAVQDAAGGFTQYVYDGDHADPALLKWKVLPRGNIPWVQTWNDVGKVATQADAYGNTTGFNYGNPQTPGTTKVTRPDGAVYVHKHDRDGNLVGSVNTLAKTIDLGTDGNHRRTTVEDYRGGISGTAWHAASGRIASETDASGNTTAYTWTARTDAGTGLVLQDLTRIDHPDGTFEAFTRDGSGNLLTHADEEGGTWIRTHDAAGRVLTEENREGGTTVFTYDAAGNRATATDPAGNTTTYGYDDMNRLVSATYGDGKTTSWTYDLLDRRTSATDEEGGVTTWTYDPNGNLTAITDFDGNTVAIEYDLMDRPVSILDALGRESTVTYDVLGRFSTKTNRAGSTWTNGWDTRDLMTAVTVPGGQVWTTEYDADGRVAASVDPLGRRHAWTRDAAGRVVRAVTPAGRTARFLRDDRGRFTGMVDGEDRPDDRVLDGRGLVVRGDRGGGTAAADHEYDANGLLTATVDGAGYRWETARDDGGRPVSTTDPLGRTTTFGYDARNRIASHVFPSALGSLDIVYDGAGRATARNYSDGTSLAYAWEPDGLRASATGATFTRDAARRLVGCNGLVFTRDLEGRLSTVTFGPGKVVTYGYDARGFLVSVAGWGGAGVSITRDESGRETTIARTGGLTTTYGRDADGRVLSIAHGALATLLLTRDGAGDVVAADRDAPLDGAFDDEPEGIYAVDSAGQLEGATCDSIGRVTDDGTRLYTWDLATRLGTLEEGATTVVWTYDGFGRPLTRTEGATTDEYVWNYACDLPAVSILKRGGLPVRYYVHAPDGMLLYSMEEAGGAIRYFHFDEVGSTLFLTDGAGALTDSYAYTPWGTEIDASGASENPYRWLGQFGVRREAAGLYRMGLRLYDAATRRFLTRDPLAAGTDPHRANPYAYADGNPLRFVDPTGEAPLVSNGQQAVEVANFGANVVGTTAEATQASLKLNGTLYSNAGRALNAGAETVGTAAAVVGAGIEVYNHSERVDAVNKRFLDEAEAAWAEHRRFLEEARELWRQKRIDYDGYTRLRRAIRQLLEERLGRNRDRVFVDNIAVGTILTLNLLTNLVPGGGLVIDWADKIEH
jgi:RHS repeat-associated protein